ncbi:hypothetical protein AB0L82_43190 [Nocardia sp. NPDC052001]|uniref:hypothetical protein n=1 Tax=Nocardia sp. NPDC052001 TaxID=3154853 RepID=UPI00343AA468
MYLDTDGIVEVPEGVTELSDFFHTNPHHGKTYTEMTREIREVATETRRRRVNHNDCDDQWWRDHFLRAARAEVN